MLHARPGSRAAGRGFARACGSSPRARCALFLYRICKKNGVTKASPSGRTFFLLPYSPTPSFVGLAGFLRTPTRFPWRLQQCCKRQSYFRGFCNNVANVNRISVAFATMLQTSTVSPWFLQQCCKRQPPLRGLCNNVASSAARVITHY